MGRPKLDKSSHTVSVAVRIPETWADEIDALAERLPLPEGLLDGHRSYVLRVLVRRGLDSVTAEHRGT